MYIIIKHGKEMLRCVTLHPSIQTVLPRPQEDNIQAKKEPS